MSDPLITSAELTASWPQFANLAAGEQTAVLLAASAAVEGHLRRQLGLGAVTETHRPGSTRQILLNVTPVVSITSIVYGKTGSTTALTTDDYTLDSATGAVELYRDFGSGYRYPDRVYGADPRYGTITVVYQGGWSTATVPADVKRAAIIAAKSMSQGVTAGMFASEQIGSYSFRLSSSAGASDSSLPATAAGLLRRYRRIRFS